MATKDRTRARSTSTGKARPAAAAPVQTSAPPNLVTRDGVLALQQTAGNAAVQRALTQRAALAPGTDNPLVGLKRQDGLDFGTFERRPQVKLLQSKLNDKVAGGLSVDGMWGGRTSKSLESFQLGQSTVPAEFVDQQTGDALLDRNGGGGGGGVEPPTPPDPAVDGTLDQIMLEYSRLHVAQSKAVTQVERDLRDGVEKKSDPILIQALKFGAEKILDGLLGGGATSFRTAIKAGITLIDDADIDGKLKEFGVDKPFDAAKAAASEKIAQELSSVGDTDPLSAFVDTQHNALAEATLKNQEAFINVSKPELRKKPAKDAQTLLNELRKQTAAANETQYTATVNRWAQVNAQRTLGITASTTNPNDLAGTTFVEGLEGKDADSVPGVLEIDINFDRSSPKSPVKVNELTIAGLSPKVREHINKKNPTLGELGFPSRASGDSTASLFGLGARLSVARAEDKGFVTEISSHAGPIGGTTPNGRQYFLDKGDGNGFVGIRRLFAEIDPLTVGALGGLKGP